MGQMKGRDSGPPGPPRAVRALLTHRAGHLQLPAGNKYLQHKWDQADYDLHRGKVKSAKPTIDMTPPKIYGHLIVKLKNIQLEEERAMKTQRENSMLAEKIAHIMRTGGGVDHRNYYERKSLGENRRQLELLRIAKENRRILVRLSQSRSHYDTRSWHEGWLKTLKVMDSIAHYPRGRTSRQKGPGRPVEKHVDGDEEAEGKAKSEGEEKRKGTSEEEDARRKMQQDIGTCPEPKAPEKHTSQETPEKHTSQDAPESPVPEEG